ncbi:hypothetical protein J6590_034547 [Homalodisca vitripennis]|nr:hypothetical protein J6590_034547 [Homalodisca vitripennis]
MGGRGRRPKPVGGVREVTSTVQGQQEQQRAAEPGDYDFGSCIFSLKKVQTLSSIQPLYSCESTKLTNHLYRYRWKLRTEWEAFKGPSPLKQDLLTSILKPKLSLCKRALGHVDRRQTDDTQRRRGGSRRVRGSFSYPSLVLRVDNFTRTLLTASPVYEFRVK